VIRKEKQTMSHKTFAYSFMTGLALIVVALIALPLGAAGAWQQPTPTVGPLSDFAIPTSTPGGGNEGGLVIPTATPGGGNEGGLVIPTATPGGGGLVIPTSTPAGPSLPALSDDQLTAINLQPSEVPADFAANQDIKTFTTDDSVATLRQQGAAQAADELQQIATTYGWQRSIGIAYTFCQPTIPISEIYSEVGQLSSPDAARQFIDDPQVQSFFSGIGFTITPADTVHGWWAKLPAQQGACFPQEIEYDLDFEYWGVLLSISMTADANTDPALVQNLINQLAPVLVRHVDGLASTPFPPTPIPQVGPAIPATEALLPTPTPIALAPTQSPILPPTTPVPLPLATQPLLPTQAAPGATLSDLDQAMPTIQEIGLPTDTFSLDQALSGTFTLDQLVAQVQALGLTQLASVMTQAGQRDGLIGEVIRVWDTGTACPGTVGLSVEVDVTLFQTAQGATNNLNDPTLQQAWIGTGIISTFSPSGDGLLAKGTLSHRCGTVQYFDKLVAHGRFVVAVSAIANPGAGDQDIQTILTAIDTLNSYMIQKLDGAGLQ
jgi:hypothetical protein